MIKTSISKPLLKRRLNLKPELNFCFQDLLLQHDQFLRFNKLIFQTCRKSWSQTFCLNCQNQIKDEKKRLVQQIYISKQNKNFNSKTNSFLQQILSQAQLSFNKNQLIQAERKYSALIAQQLNNSLKTLMHSNQNVKPLKIFLSALNDTIQPIVLSSERAIFHFQNQKMQAVKLLGGQIMPYIYIQKRKAISIQKPIKKIFPNIKRQNSFALNSKTSSQSEIVAELDPEI